MATKLREQSSRSSDVAQVEQPASRALPYRTIADVRARLEGAVGVLLKAKDRYRELEKAVTQRPGEELLPVAAGALEAAAALEPEVDAAIERVKARAAMEAWTGRSEVLQLVTQVERGRHALERRMGSARLGAATQRAQQGELVATKLRHPIAAMVVALAMAGYVTSFFTGPKWLAGFLVMMVVTEIWQRLTQKRRWYSVYHSNGVSELVQWSGQWAPRKAKRFRVPPQARLHIEEDTRPTAVGPWFSEQQLWLYDGDRETLLGVFNAPTDKAQEMTRDLARALGCEADLS